MNSVAAPRPRIEPMPLAPTGARPFLTAAWRDFLMLSYEIDAEVLRPFIPRGTEIDEWCGRTYVSLVGFRFCNARLLGIRVPGHQHFAEVNLRFYVRRRTDGGWRRGVVFLRELAAKRCVAIVARWIYGERFRRVPLVCSHDRTLNDAAIVDDVALPPPSSIAYTWRDRGCDYRLAAKLLGKTELPRPESLAEHIVDHYWAYTATPRGAAYEYLVPHPPWRIAECTTAEFTGDPYRQYGPRFAPYLRGEPASAFWATGSKVSVYRGTKL